DCPSANNVAPDVSITIERNFIIRGIAVVEHVTATDSICFNRTTRHHHGVLRGISIVGSATNGNTVVDLGIVLDRDRIALGNAGLRVAAIDIATDFSIITECDFVAGRLAIYGMATVDSAGNLALVFDVHFVIGGINAAGTPRRSRTIPTSNITSDLA